MKLYYFNPHDYNCQYFVMAYDPAEALGFVQEFIKRRFVDFATSNPTQTFNLHDNDLKLWEYCTVDNLPLKYTVDEYSHGEVIESEIA